MTTEDRVNRMEDVIVLLKDLIVRHEERLDTHEERLYTFDTDFKRSREDFEFKMNALIDAQLKNEEGFAELRKSIGELRDESRSQVKRIEKLERL